MKVLTHPDEWAAGAIGLSAEALGDGLLFAMKEAAPWPVHMNGVLVPLDVYWLSQHAMVLEHASFMPGMPVYWPDCRAQYVLELPMSDEPRYHVGDFVELPV